LNEIERLRNQAGTKLTPRCFSKDIRLGDSGDEVEALHSILESEGFQINLEEKNSRRFGENTLQAVKRFQEKYADSVLIPVDLSSGTGFVGAKTRERLNSISRCFSVSEPIKPIVKDIQVVYPNGGETLYLGDSVDIEWKDNRKYPDPVLESYNPNNDSYDIYIQRADKDEAYKKLIAISIKRDSSSKLQKYNWKVGTLSELGELLPVGPYEIVVCPSGRHLTVAKEYCGKSDNKFVISSKTRVKREIKVVTPNGGEKWSVGEIRNIVWKTNGSNSDKIRISLTNECTKDIKHIATAFDTGSFNWYISKDLADDECGYKVRISPADEKSKTNTFDESDNWFFIYSNLREPKEKDIIFKPADTSKGHVLGSSISRDVILDQMISILLGIQDKLEELD